MEDITTTEKTALTDKQIKVFAYLVTFGVGLALTCVLATALMMKGLM